MIVEFLKAHKEKTVKHKKEEQVYSGAYYTLGGVITGFLIDEFYEKFHLPGFNQKIEHSLITHRKIENCKEIKFDKFVIMMLSAGIMMLELFGVKGAMASGAGIMLGYTYSSTSREGKYVGNV
jgi:hypothetical protein